MSDAVRRMDADVSDAADASDALHRQHRTIRYSVFTKPWPTMSLAELGEWVAGLGFDGIELPVRPGYQVPPERVGELPQAAAQLAGCGVKILSIAPLGPVAPTDEPTIAACAEAGIPTIRVMARIAGGESYFQAEARLWREYDVLIPLLDKYGVQVGIQNHCGRFVSNPMGLRRLVERYDPRQVAIVWDAAHNTLQGEEIDLSLDIVWPHLCMVNLKNAFWQRVAPEPEVAQWKVYWTSGRQGLTSWPRVAEELLRRHYSGVVCLTAEYSEAGADKVHPADVRYARVGDHPVADRLIAEDVAFARSLFA